MAVPAVDSSSSVLVFIEQSVNNSNLLQTSTVVFGGMALGVGWRFWWWGGWPYAGRRNLPSFDSTPADEERASDGPSSGSSSLSPCLELASSSALQV